jgi:hypothetical protein
MSPTILAENIKTKTCRIIILPVAYMDVKRGLSREGGTLAEGVREKGAEEDIPGRSTRVVERLQKEELYEFYSSLNIILVIK